MGDTMLVHIPVSPAVAEARSDEQQRAKIGRLVSGILRPSSPDDDPLAVLIAQVKSDALPGGLGDPEIAAELGKYHAERRL